MLQTDPTQKTEKIQVENKIKRCGEIDRKNTKVFKAQSTLDKPIMPVLPVINSTEAPAY
jgi:hypothetical protein